MSTTYIPFGNNNRMTFQSIPSGQLIYASNGLLSSVSAPSAANQVIMSTASGSNAGYVSGFITCNTMGLASNVNQMFYTVSNSSSIKSLELPANPDANYIIKYDDTLNEYKLKDFGGYAPVHYDYKLYTASNNSTVAVDSLNLNTLYSDSGRSTLVTFPQLIPTHSFKITTTLRLWLNDYTAINPPNDCTVLDFKNNYASRVTITCKLGAQTTTIYDTLVGNVAMQEFQSTQTSTINCDLTSDGTPEVPVFIIDSTNNGPDGLILEPYISCIELTIDEIPNTVYVGMQPVKTSYTVKATTTSTSNPLYIASSLTTGIYTNNKLTWTVSSNMGGSTLKMTAGHNYSVFVNLKMFFAGPSRLSAPSGYTALQWKTSVLPIVTLQLVLPDNTVLPIASGLFGNIATMCFEISGANLIENLSNNMTSLNVQLVVTNFGNTLTSGDWNNFISFEVITPCIEFTIVEL